MAVLESGHLKVEFNFIDHFEANYSIQFSYDSRPLVNPEIMGEGFIGYDRGDTLTPVLEEVLANDNSNVWKPYCPAVIIEIRPFHKQGWNEQRKDFRATPEYAEYLKKVDERRAESGGKLPDDYFELTFLADVVGLRIPYPRDTNYIGDYLALRITATREDLQRFVDVLKQEHAIYLRGKEILK